MADIIETRSDLGKPVPIAGEGDSSTREPGRPPDQATIEIIELLFFAYRDFISDPDAILDEIGFGRAHHRVLHFVDRHPGLRVADLLDILKITKQSLARVLKQLVDEGYIAQEAGRMDRRERLLFATSKGRALADRLASPQLERIGNALGAAGPVGLEAVKAFLESAVDVTERERVKNLVVAATSRGDAS